MNKGRLVKKTELYRELKQALEFKKFSEMTITHPNKNVIDKIENVKFNDGKLEIVSVIRK